jgi:hypothetical protein
LFLVTEFGLCHQFSFGLYECSICCIELLVFLWNRARAAADAGHDVGGQATLVAAAAAACCCCLLLLLLLLLPDAA